MCHYNSRLVFFYPIFEGHFFLFTWKIFSKFVAFSQYMNFFAPQIFRTSYSPAAQVRSNQPLTFATKYCVVVCNYMGYNLVITTPFSALFFYTFSPFFLFVSCVEILCTIWFLTFFVTKLFLHQIVVFYIQIRATLKYLKVSRPGAIDKFSNVNSYILRRPQCFAWHYIGQKLGGDFAKFCGLLRIYELIAVWNFNGTSMEWYLLFCLSVLICWGPVRYNYSMRCVS